MPQYVYTCIFKHECTVIEPMETDTEHKCIICGGIMWRKPQIPMINWNGLKPSAGELPPAVQEHVDNVDRIREETDEFYYERDKNKPE
jgi:hypothetical protein